MPGDLPPVGARVRRFHSVASKLADYVATHDNAATMSARDGAYMALRLVLDGDEGAAYDFLTAIAPRHRAYDLVATITTYYIAEVLDGD